MKLLKVTIFSLFSWFLLANNIMADTKVEMNSINKISLEQKNLLIDNLGQEFYEEIENLIKEGYEITIKYNINVDDFNDGPRDIREPKIEPKDRRSGRSSDCEVTVRETSSRGGNGSVGVRVGEMSGGGHSNTTTDITVKGPCEEVRKILNDIRTKK